MVLMELQPSEPNCSLVLGDILSLTLQLIAKLRQRVDTQEMCIEQGRLEELEDTAECPSTASLSRLTQRALYLLNLSGAMACS